MKKLRTQTNKILEAQDFTNKAIDYRRYNSVKKLEEKPDYIPDLSFEFFKRLRYVVPAVKLGENEFILPLNARNIGRNASVEDCIALAVCNLDVLYETQDYFYRKAKKEYDGNPRIKVSRRLKRSTEGKLEVIETTRKIPMRKGGSNTMSFLQYNIALEFYDERTVWERHRELTLELKYKGNDSNFLTEELDNSYAKGEETSYGDANLSDSLYQMYGVHTKLQNGKHISESINEEIRHGLIKIFATYGDLSEHCRSFGLKISYSGSKLMHARNFSGIFYPYFKSIGISKAGDMTRTMAHEFAHFLDFIIGNEHGRQYFSDDSYGLAGRIAKKFRANMVRYQDSDYLNRSMECFARALEQYFCLMNGINIANEKGNYVQPEFLKQELLGDIEEFLDQFKKGVRL